MKLNALSILSAIAFCLFPISSGELTYGQPNIFCYQIGNEAGCKCTPGFKENPSGPGCIADPDYKGDPCTENGACRETESCIGGFCVDPCRGDLPCGPNADCEVSEYKKTCKCQDGFVGSPHGTGCHRRADDRCYSHSHCNDDHRCRGGRCVDACKSRCLGRNVKCIARNHNYKCECKNRNYYGDPWSMEGCYEF